MEECLIQHETLTTEKSAWELGPYHSSLPGPMRLRLVLDGEIVSSCEFEVGYLHRGIEKILEKQSWTSAIPYVDRLDPESAVFGELVYCLAIEEILGKEIPPRANSIRLILSELTRISSHLRFMVKMAQSVDAETPVHYLLRDREKILDLFELLTGARFSINFLRVGGVTNNVTEGFLDRVVEVCDLIRVRIKEYNDLFSFNHSFLRRTSGIGRVPSDLIQNNGVTGPNARASGVEIDTRKAHPYCGYEKIDFEVVLGSGERGVLGDCHDRFLVHLREVSQSIEIIKQEIEQIPQGDFIKDSLGEGDPLPSGEAFSRVETGRGLLGCHVISNGGSSPERVQFRTPSLSHLGLLPPLLKGIWLGDLPVILASLDICVSEVDR